MGLRRGEPGGVAWAYLIGGDGDGHFLEDECGHSSAFDRSGAAMLSGPGGWVYRASNQHVLCPGRGRCRIYHAHKWWVAYEQAPDVETGPSASRRRPAR